MNLFLTSNRTGANWFTWLTVAGIFLSSFCVSNVSFANEKQRVLFISSYHPGFPTFFQQIDGIKEVFTNKDIILDIEFMDTKRFPQKSNWGIFQSSLEYKIQKVAPYNAIIVADDNALIFALEQQDRLFKDLPIVFLGINNIKRALEQNNNPQITGVIENVSMDETIELMIRLRPKTTRIVALVDGTPSGQGDLVTFYKTAKKFKTHDFSDISLSNLTWNEFLESINELEDDSAILLLSAYKDKNNITYLFDESLRLIQDNVSIPIFHLWAHGLGEGILGGKVVSHIEQGKLAAKIVLEIFRGTPVEKIKVVNLSPNRFMFDYTVINEYSIKESLLPNDSILLNLPYSFYRENKTIFWAVAFIFLTLSLSLFFAILNNFRRKKIENILKDREIHLRTIIETIPELVWLKNPEGIYLSCNPRFERFFGAKEKEIIGKTDYDFVDKELADFFRKNDKLSMAAGKPSVNEEEIVYADDGHKELLETIKTPMHDPDGKIIGVLGIARDITERKEAEKEIIKSEQKYRTLFENMAQGVFYQNADGIIFDFNQNALDMFGLTSDQFLGKTSFDPEWRVIHEDGSDYPGQQHPSMVALKTGKPILDAIAGVFNPAKNDYTWLNINAIPQFKNGESKPYQVFVTLHDITDIKKAEEKIRQSHKMEAIGTIAGGVAHDFNNILSIILGNTELALEDTPERSHAQSNLEEIKTASLRARDVVKQLLTFSRKTEQLKKVIEVNSLVEESIKLLRSSIPTSIEIHVDLPENSNRILADATQLHQVLINLCTNASHAMEKVGGTLSIKLSRVQIDEINIYHFKDIRPGEYVQFSISDTGIGISESNKDKIFDPYFTTKQVGKGTGMGLSVVLGIVRSHNGTVSVYSEPNKGSTFKVLFPLVDEEIEEETSKPEEMPGGNEKILFVDDEDSIAKMGSEILSRLGYKVTTETDSLAALNLVKSDPLKFDLIVSDMTMPKLAGDVLAIEILKIQPDMPIILCTGFSHKIDKDEALKIGICQYLEKPINKTQLAKVVREALSKSKNKI